MAAAPTGSLSPRQPWISDGPWVRMLAQKRARKSLFFYSRHKRRALLRFAWQLWHACIDFDDYWCCPLLLVIDVKAALIRSKLNIETRRLRRLLRQDKNDWVQRACENIEETPRAEARSLALA
eukprot:1648979-Amphidinium_carterae.1